MYIYLELSLHFATQNSRVTLSWSDGLFFLSAFTHFLFLTANPLGSVIYKSAPLSWIWASVSQICWKRVCFLDISLHIRGRDELFCLRTEIASLPHGKKGFGNLLKINFLHKNDSRQKQYSITDMKMLLLTRKIGKACEVRNFFCFAIASPRTQTYFRLSLGQPEIRVCVRRRPRLHDRLHSRHFFSNLEPGRYRKPGGGGGTSVFFALRTRTPCRLSP